MVSNICSPPSYIHGWANCAHIKNYILVSEKGAGMLLKIPVGQVLLKDANLVCTK